MFTLILTIWRIFLIELIVRNPKKILHFLLTWSTLVFAFLYERSNFCSLVMWNAFVKTVYHIEMQNEN
jgi:hypothetical protein